MKNKFGKNIAELRHQHGWSQKETAAKFGISQALLSHYEKGIRECGLEFLCKAATVFNCSTDRLLGLDSSSIKKQNDTDNISADTKPFPKLERTRNDTVNTLNLLYSITARIGNPEICKDFSKLMNSEIYMLLRTFETRYFASENFKKDAVTSIANARQQNAVATAGILNRMHNENINVNLSKARIEEEYPICSKGFNTVINMTER